MYKNSTRPCIYFLHYAQKSGNLCHGISFSWSRLHFLLAGWLAYHLLLFFFCMLPCNLDYKISKVLTTHDDWSVAAWNQSSWNGVTLQMSFIVSCKWNEWFSRRRKMDGSKKFHLHNRLYSVKTWISRHAHLPQIAVIFQGQDYLWSPAMEHFRVGNYPHKGLSDPFFE